MEDINLQNFVNACEQIKDGGFLMAKKHINKLIYTIASDNTLLDILTECNKCAIYEQELTRANPSKNAFKLPTDSRKIVALVSGMLYAFDRNQMNMAEFLNTKFSALSIDISFEQFCDFIITPYKDAYCALINTSVLEYQDNERKSDTIIPISLTEQINPYLTGILKNIMLESFSETKKQEYIDIVEGFKYIIESGNSKILRAMWLGLRNSFNQHKTFISSIKAIEMILETFALL